MISFVKTRYSKLFNSKRLKSLVSFFLNNNFLLSIEIQSICFSFFFTLLTTILTLKYFDLLTIPYICLYLLNIGLILFGSFLGFLVGSITISSVAVRFLVMTESVWYRSLWLQGVFLVLLISNLLFFLGMKMIKDTENELKRKHAEIFKKLTDTIAVDKSCLSDMALEKEELARTVAEQLTQLEIKESENQEICEKLTFFESEMKLLIKNRSSWIENYNTLYQELLIAKDSSRFSELEARLEELLRLVSNLEEEVRSSEIEKNKLQDSYFEIMRLKEKMSVENEQLKVSLQVLKDNSRILQSPEVSNEAICLNNPLSHELARYKGLYSQLKEQFQDKDKNLFLSRKELFIASNELISLKRKEELFLDYEEEELGMTATLIELIGELEREIMYLEELIFHNPN